MRWSPGYRLGLGLGETLGAGLAEALTDGDGLGSAGGGGGLFPTISAMGTMTMPTRTVSTKVTAPHSRTRNDRFTSGEYYTRNASP